jgi:hypothetical protein
VASGNDIREFLTTRRARITPNQAELHAYGGRRRVSGLRREEVAMLAGISVEYYTNSSAAACAAFPKDVLDALARALPLDDVERIHLFDLVRADKPAGAINALADATLGSAKFEEEHRAMRCDAFREAVERGDVEATMATMSPAVVLRSPVRDEPLQGIEAVGRLFEALLPAFDELRFIESYTSRDGGELLHFQWRIGNHHAEGVDMMHFDNGGLIDDYRVMLRPLSAVTALRDAVFAKLTPGSTPGS